MIVDYDDIDKKLDVSDSTLTSRSSSSQYLDSTYHPGEHYSKIGLIVCIVGACQLLHDWLTKKTRAIRRRLTKCQASLKIERVNKKEMYFPMRKYVIKV
ncbi:hypothetical protein CMV_026370 [Castanea mollissima]|uniref:Uncharacterized protein n=1 Tax=Castanea mollissima TaxID=60419 RepID=A0A8J4Q7Z5_9ROSI|nr:hypothetical protein CMV_026370 [Castanea mollissima]